MTLHFRRNRRYGRGCALRVTVAAGLLAAGLGEPLPAAAADGKAAGWQGMAVVREVKSWSYEDYTRVVLYLDRKVSHAANELPADPVHGKPPRIYLNLEETRIAPAVPSELPIGDGLLRRARIAQFDKHTARLVLDMESVAEFQVVPFRNPDRLVIDVRGKNLKRPQASPPEMRAKSGSSNDPVADLLGGGDGSESKAKAAERKSREGPYTIVVDAGHGGKDPGAVGYKDLYEKGVVLAIAAEVADQLEARGHEVIMTRDTDVFISLEERTVIANREQADLFVSVHANSAASPRAYGIETYHLAPASDERSARVAARENALSANESDALEELLSALRFSSRQNVSSILAKFVQSSLADAIGSRYKGFKDLGVKGAPFYVLVGTNMPAVLVEVGFVTHPEESKRLQDRNYRHRLSESIVRGVEAYLEKSGKIPI